MITQLINITYPNVLNYYKNKYHFGHSSVEFGDLAIELRDVTQEEYSELEKIFSSTNLNYFSLPNSEANVDIFVKNYKILISQTSKDHLLNDKKNICYKFHKTISNYNNYNNRNSIESNIKIDQNISYIMGILNVTPDSFSDGGKYNDSKLAIAKAAEMLNNGADIIDIGGESTRPGSESISENEELKRVIPVIEGILKKFPDAVLSIDTVKAKVAEEALNMGVKLVNDVSAFNKDTKILDVIKKYNAALIIMHMKGNPKTMQVTPHYEEVISEIYSFLHHKLKAAMDYGIEKMIIDPGIGFGKRVEDNYEIIKRLDEFKSLGFPILIGLSRKSFIGKSLNLGIDNRDIATTVLESAAINNGALIIRTHNVSYAKQTQQIMNLLSSSNTT